jgi:hypothetical protein
MTNNEQDQKMTRQENIQALANAISKNVHLDRIMSFSLLVQPLIMIMLLDQEAPSSIFPGSQEKIWAKIR